MVPIKLDDGKVIQRNKEETIERKSEFTNYSHQEFIKSQSTKEIPRFDAPTNMPSETFSKPLAKERVIPITLENTGQTIIPSFTKLEDPQPPEWSTFSQKNMSKQNAKETVVPIRLVDIADEESVSVAGSEYENAPKQRPEENTNPKYANDWVTTPSSISDKTGARPKKRNPSHNSQDNVYNAGQPHTGENKPTNFKYDDKTAFTSSRSDKPFSRSSTEKPAIPPKPPKSPTIKAVPKSPTIKIKGDTTTDTKKILSKTTETTKTTTEKRSQVVRFNLDDDDDEEEEGHKSRTDLSKANGKRPKFENSRMR